MYESAGISPWSHPKAREWFETIFDRSGALLSLTDEIFKHGNEFDIPQIRLFASILILIGRDGIWPRSHQQDLVKVVEKLNDVLKRRVADTKTPLTIEEHKIHSVLTAQAEHEMELLRRAMGLSRRMNRLGQPSSWTGFWCN